MACHRYQAKGCAGNGGHRYQQKLMISKGVYGTFWQATDMETNEMVTMKQISAEPFREQTGSVPACVIREVTFLRGFVHPNVARLLSVHDTGMSEYNLIFEYVETDLHSVMNKYRSSGDLMPMSLVTKYFQDLLHGLHACHLRQILHRNLMPQNLLIAPDGLKIGGFGMARQLSTAVATYTRNVVTLWYRAPEVLLGQDRYGPAVDMWSSGCILAEMVTLYPLFPGESDIGTIFKIFKLLGTPTEEIWPGVDELAYWKSTFPKWAPTKLETVFDLGQQQELGEAGIDLIVELLKLSPNLRMSSTKATTHRFFQQHQKTMSDC